MTFPFADHGRQIHLDFHTSPYILDVAHEFDAREFARTLQEAHVNSATVFAKCHHGMCYYPTKTGTQHPALAAQDGRDLLGEQIEALHRAGIRCPIYTTIVWEEDAAQKYPAWRQLRQDGTFVQHVVDPNYTAPHPGAWKWLNFLNPDYQNYIEAHLRELFARYGAEIDGFFLDILMLHRDADWSESGLRFREQHGLLSDDAATWRHLEAAGQKAFAQRFTPLIRGALPEATIFYNSGTYLSADSSVGARPRAPLCTHFEIESLPSGFWGYHHFPRQARLIGNWRVGGQPQQWLAMTGRFQKQWGDFGGIKPQPALEFECFRAQAMGGANSVGDQLPPRGQLDPDAYSLIGAVFRQVADAEPFYAGSAPLPQVGIVCPFAPGLDATQTDKSEEGAVMMCEEAYYDAKMLDDASEQDEFDALDLIILPDNASATPALIEKLQCFYAKGGKLLLSHRAGFAPSGEWLCAFLPLAFHGETDKWPTYWRARPEFLPGVRGDRVIYERGLNAAAEGTTVLAERVLPYFQRTDVHFSSHFQTPPQSEADPFAAVLAGERWVYFADPIFREYRQSGNLTARDGWKAAMQRMVGTAPFGEGLPTTVGLYPRRRGDDLILTLLHYVPVRKALDIDVIEERMSFAGLTLRMPQTVRMVRIWNGEELGQVEGGFALPAQSGRLLLEVPGYFRL